MLTQAQTKSNKKSSETRGMSRLWEVLSEEVGGAIGSGKIGFSDRQDAIPFSAQVMVVLALTISRQHFALNSYNRFIDSVYRPVSDTWLAEPRPMPRFYELPVTLAARLRLRSATSSRMCSRSSLGVALIRRRVYGSRGWA